MTAAGRRTFPPAGETHVLILVTGASGFIGRRLCAALERRGHGVLRAVRDPASARAQAPDARFVAADFARDLEPKQWLPRLAGVDAVANCAGILREGRGRRFGLVHERGPVALFTACAQAGVRRVVQVSAQGADEHARSAYHRSKRAADAALLALPLSAAVAQPSIVYGEGGTSAALFTRLASLPWVPLPGDGGQRLQPIHVDDLVAALVALVEADAPRGIVPLAGPEPLALRELLTQLRAGMELPRAPFLEVPMPLMRLGARLAAWIPGSLLDAETLDMLARGNTGDPAPARALIRRELRPPREFTAPAAAAPALLGWLLPLLRLSLAALWLGSALVSFGLYPAADSTALLARAGVTGALAPVALYGAAALDLLLGLACLHPRPPRVLWLAQMALILAYTAILTVAMPELWLHPFGPILKNVPLLAALLLLHQLPGAPAR